MDIFGDKGSIHVPVLNAGDMTVRTQAGDRTEEHSPEANFHQPLIDDFTHAVLDDGSPAVNGEIGREVARIEEIIFNNLKFI